MSAAIRPDAAVAARCAELAQRARRCRQRAAAIRGGAAPAVMTRGQLLAMARDAESQIRMAADAALDEATRALRGNPCEVSA